MSNVSEISQQLMDIVLNRLILRDVWMQGKISEVNLLRNGNAYFTLKDNVKKIECVIFDVWAPLQENLPAVGSSISVRGQIYIYKTKKRI